MICRANQWNGFYMIGNTVMKELKILYFKFYKFLKFLSRAGCLIITKTSQKYFSSNSLFLKNRLVSRKCQPNETTELDVLCKKN